MIEFSNKIVGVNIRDSLDKEEEWSNYLFNLIKGEKINIGTVYFHVFSGGLNHELAKKIYFSKLDDFKKNKFLFYADGSRNNTEIEWSRDSTSLLKLFSEGARQIEVVGFGFKPEIGKALEGIKTIKRTYIDYKFLDAVFILSKDKVELNKKIDGKVSLVLARYWGRDPYKFKTDDLLIQCYASSISKAIKFNDIIYRKDNRCDFSIVDVSSCTSLSNKNIFDIANYIVNHEDKLEEILFENILHNVPELFAHLGEIYCFDSSFPLVFTSPTLYRSLSNETTIISGFDYEEVQKNSLGFALEVMVTRVTVLIFDMLKLEIFNIFDSFGPISVAENNLEVLTARIKSNGGLFLLKKNINLKHRFTLFSVKLFK
jgi:hypothetical protein